MKSIRDRLKAATTTKELDEGLKAIKNSKQMSAKTRRRCELAHDVALLKMLDK